MPGISIRNKISKLPYADMDKLPSTKVPEQIPVGSDYYTDDSSISPMTEAEKARMGKWKDKPVTPDETELWKQEFQQQGEQVGEDPYAWDVLGGIGMGAVGAGRKIAGKMAERASISRPSPRAENLQRIFREPPSPDYVPPQLEKGHYGLKEGITPVEPTPDVIAGRPWPKFLPDQIPIGKGYSTDAAGNVFDSQGKLVGTVGINPAFTPGQDKFSYHTNAGFYKESPEGAKAFRNAAINKAAKKAKEVHGTLLSDLTDSMSPSAIKAWSKDPDVIPLKPGGTWGNARFAAKHPTGGNIRGIVEELRKNGLSISQEEVEAYLKKYGGNAILGLLGTGALGKKTKDQ